MMPSPDAEILALADRFLVLHAQRDAMDFDPDDKDDEAQMMALIGDQSSVLVQMDGLTATTLAGHRARAACLQKWFGIRANGNGHSLIEGPHVGALFRDLLGAEAV